jgi:hypothetical protein
MDNKKKINMSTAVKIGIGALGALAIIVIGGFFLYKKLFNPIQTAIDGVTNPTSTTPYVSASGGAPVTPEAAIKYFKVNYSGDVLKNRILTEAKHKINKQSDTSTIKDYTFNI